MEGLSVSQIVTIVISILSLLGLGTVSTFFWTDLRARKKEKLETQSNEHKKILKEERQEAIREVLKEELNPLKETLETLKEDNDLNKAGLQAVLRDRLYELYKYCTYDRCKGKLDLAYSTLDEKQNFENMYIKYHSLGVNGVMDKKYNTFMMLPDQEPKQPKPKQPKKSK